MQPQYSRTNPFPAKMVVNRRLNEGNRNKETRHHEMSLAGSGLTFEPGDSMAVYATNDPPLVEEVIRAIGATGNEIVPAGKNETAPLRQALLRNPELFVTTATEKLLTYALGRGVEDYDAPAVRRIVRTAHGDDYRFSSLVLGIVNSTPFQMRRSQ